MQILAAGIGFAMLCAVLCSPGGAASPEPAVAKSKKGKRVIVRPKAGQRVRRNPVEVVVRGRDGLFDVKARLNGKKISEAFGRTHKGKRRARISRSHGLKRGRNVLRVKARRRIGQRRRKAKVVFFVRHKRPLAGAGRNRRIVEGERFRLRGGALPYPRKPRVRENRRIRYRWRITKAPRQSAFRDNAKAGSARLAGKPLDKPAARHPGFTPDIRGQYRFKLRVADGNRSSTDEVLLNAVPGTPFVPVETVSTSTSPAIKVGNVPYQADRSVYAAWLQVVVLDRKSLGLISNTTYACESESCSPEASGVAAELSKLDDTKLVIAASPGDPNVEAPASYPQALAPIGFPKLDPRPFHDALSGTVSAIGVPHLPAGQADIRFDPGGQLGSGNMDGYLTPNNFLDYTWLPKERPLYDTRESSRTEGGFGNVMEIGGRKIESIAPGDAGAFQLVVVDGLTLEQVDNKTYKTGCIDNTKCSTTFVGEMIQRLRQVTPGQLVFITSILPRQNIQLVGPDTDWGDWTVLAREIASLGASKHTFFEASAKKGASYTLFGWGGAGETNGEESTSVKDPLPGAGRLQGSLMPDHTSQFRPVVTSVGDAPNEALMQLALKPEGPWPLDGNAQAQNAIKWIGGQIKQLGANPRSAYWIQDPDTEPEAWWRARAGDVGALKYPGQGHGFSKGSFNLAQAELVKEIKWVADVRGYLGDLSSPFSDEALQSFEHLDVIYNEVNDALHPPDDKTNAIVSDVIRGLVGVIGIAGGPPGEAVAEVFQVAIDIIGEQQDGSDINDINVRASQLEAQLEDRLVNAQEAIKRIGDIVVADYSKLSTVGTNAECAPGPDCPVDWRFTGEDQQSAASSVYKGIETLFTEQLMPLAFPAYRLDPDLGTRNARDWLCLGDLNVKAFDNNATNQHLPDNGQAELIILRSQILDWVYQVYALGSDFPQNAFLFEIDKLTVPPADILNRMFSPASSSLDPEEGGLGIYRPDFILNANPRNFPHPRNQEILPCHWPGED